MTPGADAIFTAAPAWHAFMASALDLMKAPADEWFAEPAGLGHANVGGEPVWLLPGTNPNQPMPPLPRNVHSSAAPAPKDPNNPNNPGNPRQGN
jgi:hypothetical protein